MYPLTAPHARSVQVPEITFQSMVEDIEIVEELSQRQLQYNWPQLLLNLVTSHPQLTQNQKEWISDQI